MAEAAYTLEKVKIGDTYYSLRVRVEADSISVICDGKGTTLTAALDEIYVGIAALKGIVEGGSGMSEEQYKELLHKIETLEVEVQNLKDTQVEYSVDGTMVINDDVLGVKTPIVPITQAEYDTLSVDEKTGIVHLITDAPDISNPPSGSTGLGFVPGPGLSYDPVSTELNINMFDPFDDDQNLPVSGALFMEVLGDLESILSNI